jgi:chitinase
MSTLRLFTVLTVSAAVLAPLAGCPAPVNTAPSANAGADKAATVLSAVTLNGAGSDVEGSVTFLWTQLSGTPVTISNANQATAAFTAPVIPGNLTFRLTVTDSNGATATDDIVVTVSL